ncbi:MAG: beta-lactamase family protein [Flavobacterium sp.]|nr:beta-lactamase family protein [Flavobacterium sp.]
MILLKSNYILFLIGILVLNSCKKTEKPVIKIVKTVNGTIPVMVPFENNLSELSKNFIDTKHNQIQLFYNKNWANNSMNGGFLVAKNGKIIFEKYNGFANFSSRKLINADTPIHIASVSKVLTATAILLLVDAKKLDLDAKLNTILPSFSSDVITIRTLLNHRSGLKNYAYFTNHKEVWDASINITNNDLLDILSNKNIPLEFPTNRGFSYSNTNYALLALVIEKITGMTYQKAMKTMIFGPLGMKNTFVFDLNNDAQTATPSYKWNNQKYALDFLDGIYGDKNIYSTPRDLLKLDLARHSKYFLNPDLVKQLYNGYSYEHRGTKNYGLGIRMIEWENGQKFYFHNGWWHGNTSSYISLEKEHLTIIALSNKFNHATYQVKRVASLFGNYPFKVNDSI